ncbi:hypothetical protein Tco_1189686 [Tanacetum coccineum]
MSKCNTFLAEAGKDNGMAIDVGEPQLTVTPHDKAYPILVEEGMEVNPYQEWDGSQQYQPFPLVGFVYRKTSRQGNLHLSMAGKKSVAADVAKHPVNMKTCRKVLQRPYLSFSDGS